MKKCWIYIILIHINLTVYAQAPDFQFERIGLEDGLPNMTIDALYQDNYGFIWVGTWAGLCRYDGREFEIFTSDINDSTSISANEIKDIVETPDGRIWIASNGGKQNVYEPKTGAFHQWGYTIGSRLFPYKEDRLYYLTGGSTLYRFNTDFTYNQKPSKPKLFFLFSNSSGDTKSHILNIHPQMDQLEDQLWIGCVHGLRILDLKTEEFIDILHTYPTLDPFLEESITEIIIDSDGKIWMGTLAGLFVYDPQDDLLLKYDLKNKREPVTIYAITEDLDQGIWVGTSDGLFYLSSQADSFMVYTHNPDDPSSLSHNEIRSLLIDHNNNLWIGTARGGLNKTHLNIKPTFRAVNHIHFGLRNYELVVFSFEESGKDHLWVGTNQGLFLMEKESKKIIRKYSKGDADTLGLAGETVLSIYETQDRKLYLGTRYGGLNILDLESQQMSHIEIVHKKEENKLLGKFFRSIKPALTGEDSLWLAGPRGINLVTRTNHVTYKALHSKGYYWDVNQIDSCTIEILGSGKYIYDICQDTFLLRGFWPGGAGGKGIFGKSIILSELTDKEGYTWMGSYDHGLLRWNKQTGEINIWNTQNGLPGNAVFGILEDNIGNIWISTENGLVMWERLAERFSIFTQKDGLMNNEFTSNSYFQAEDGEMYFGGNNGFVSFYPDQVVKNLSSLRPPLRITDIKLSGESLYEKTAPYLQKKVEFPAYRKQHLEFSFAALDYKQPDNILYQYKLEGLDTEWSKADSRNFAQYTNLAPGTYHFKLRSTNSDRVWQSSELSIIVEVTPLWYQTWWFKLGGPILLLSILCWVFYHYFQRLRKREKTKLEYRLFRAKQRALAAQMNHHFTFNSLNSIQRYILENNSLSAFDYISQFGKLIRRFLNQAEEDYLSIEEEITTLELYLSLESLRCKNKFRYEFRVDPDIDIFNTEIPTNLIQPFIENAIWHGLIPLKNKKGKLVVSFNREGHNMLISIEDNGIGRALAQELKQKTKGGHISKGMDIVSERIEVLNMRNEQKSKMEIHDKKDSIGNITGTRVNLYIPFI